jgi:hypothetical protein
LRVDIEKIRQRIENILIISTSTAASSESNWSLGFLRRDSSWSNLRWSHSHLRWAWDSRLRHRHISNRRLLLNWYIDWWSLSGWAYLDLRRRHSCSNGWWHYITLILVNMWNRRRWQVRLYINMRWWLLSVWLILIMRTWWSTLFNYLLMRRNVRNWGRWSNLLLLRWGLVMSNRCRRWVSSLSWLLESLLLLLLVFEIWIGYSSHWWSYFLRFTLVKVRLRIENSWSFLMRSIELLNRWS